MCPLLAVQTRERPTGLCKLHAVDWGTTLLNILLYRDLALPALRGGGTCSLTRRVR